MNSRGEMSVPSNQGSENPGLKKSPIPLVLGGFVGFWALLVFQTFYLNEQFGSLLVDLAHHLSFYLDMPVF